MEVIHDFSRMALCIFIETDYDNLCRLSGEGVSKKYYKKLYKQLSSWQDTTLKICHKEDYKAREINGKNQHYDRRRRCFRDY